MKALKGPFDVTIKEMVLEFSLEDLFDEYDNIAEKTCKPLKY